jgi:7,8-dihydropterin-6-yl-methyl-4-(beta-D-ribofuranosyl)aminobenzene 5'-phosphate synthase
MISIVVGLAALLIVLAGLYAVLEIRYVLGRRRVAAEWQSRPAELLTGMGSTRTLDILPLIDWFPGRPELLGEPGVSYLIRTDHATVLLDMGLNLQRADPSPLQHNMWELGIAMTDIDTVVISHNHVDHVGGWRWRSRGTFSPGNIQPDLSGKKLIVPVPMDYPGNRPQVTSNPTVLAPGVATVGVIVSQLFISRVDEQALAVNVEGKGIVLVVGCGHQTLPKLLVRAAELFKEPLYGIVGGLHYPVPRGRISQCGVDLQNLVVFGLTHKPGRAQVQAHIHQLAQRNPQWVSVSAHDSSDETIKEFHHVFGARYHDLRVGVWQHISKWSPELLALRRPSQLGNDVRL